MHRGLWAFLLKDAHGEITDETCHETTLRRHKVHRATGRERRSSSATTASSLQPRSAWAWKAEERWEMVR